VSATDPLTFTVLPLLLGAVAVLASAVPARRAARLDPATVLRAE
jgi:ABC-type lipoprotein release transport system permease subunit